METYYNEGKWIWENEKFPKFIYNEINLEDLYYKFGQLKMVDKFISNDDRKELLADTLSDEVLFTSEIEGEILQRSSVRSSINKILKLGFEEDYSSTAQTDAIVDIVIDAKQNVDIPLTKDRIFSWHKALFPTGQSGLTKINIGAYRNSLDDMQILSGPFGKEKIHYIAPPSSNIETLMDDFLNWLNCVDKINVIYKAAIAHLWFVLIHPFDDGNGRIARAISDYVLSYEKLADAKFYSVSAGIIKQRKSYYDVLDKACINKDMNIDLWIEWFVKLLSDCLEDTLSKVEIIKVKANFWDRNINFQLNLRQKKVILKMLSCLPDEFEGGMKVKKFMNITKSTRITASRDLTDLTEKGIMQRSGMGRGIYYTLKV